MALVDWEGLTKVCRGCGEDKPVEQYGLYARGAGQEKKYRRARCNGCRSAGFRALALTDSRKRQQRDAWLRRTYAISLEQYEQLLIDQDGGCAICRAEPGDRAHAVDHDHDTGVVRGLLCDSCNQGLGRFQDSAELLQAAAEYLNGSS